MKREKKETYLARDTRLEPQLLLPLLMPVLLVLLLLLLIVVVAVTVVVNDGDGDKARIILNSAFVTENVDKM